MISLNGSISFAVSELLTTRDKLTLQTLPPPLQNVLTSLLAASIGKTCETVYKILHLASTTEQTMGRDRFFLQIAKDAGHLTHLSLRKIKLIVEEGFFADFLRSIDCPTKTYHSSEVLIRLVDDFYNKELLVKKRHRDDKRLALEQEGFSADSVITVEYNKIFKCRHFFQHTPLVKEYFKYTEEKGSYLKFLYEYLISQLHTTYESKFAETERLKIVQILFRIGSPNKLNDLYCYSNIDILEFLELANTLKKRAGEEMLDLFFNSVLSYVNLKFYEINRGLQLLVNASDKDNFSELMDRWQERGCDWLLVFEILEAEAVHVDFDTLNDVDELDKHIRRFRNDPTVITPLSNEDLELIRHQYIQVNHYCELFCNLSFNQLIAIAVKIRENAKVGPISLEERLKLIAISRLAIRIHFGIYPYSTQILALLGVMARNNSRQAQVKTGEGKSTIVAMWAFVNAMECMSVDIITSARYLAIRDQLKFEVFFRKCSITSSHICYDQQRPKHFEAQILYGPSFDFEFALMRDMLNGSNLFKTRLLNPFVKDNFDRVCVDESDNLLIDAASNGARTSFPAEESFDWVYAPLLRYLKLVSDPKSKATDEEKNSYSRFRESFEGLNLLELLSEDIQNNPLLAQIKKSIDEANKIFIVNTKNYLMEHIDLQHRKACSKLDDQKICKWILSAITASHQLQEKKDYVVEKKQQPDGRETREIHIVDLKTGRISQNSRWEGGIHEFLEIKHDITVAKESLNPISYSHSVFFNKYKTITALTGTAERQQTKEIYNIESFDVPPHRPLARIDHPVIVTRGREQHLEQILRIMNETIKNQRPILVLCENIEDSEKLNDVASKHGFKCQLLNEVQEELEHDVISKAGIPGKITIATNTAGRGTDIILTPESLLNGGLLVLLTFFPGTEREEFQAIGRAGRQGQPGGSIMVIDRYSENITPYLKDIEHIFQGDEFLKCLKQKRSKREIAESKVHFQKVELDFFLADLTHQFFCFLNQWYEKVSSESFLDFNSQRLNKLKMRQNRNFDFQNLVNKDVALAELCVQLLKKYTEPLEWKLLLTQTVTRIKEKIIQKWALRFYQPITSMLTKNQAIDKSKKEIQKLFDEFKNEWERILKLDGTGVFIYLEEITTVKIPK